MQPALHLEHADGFRNCDTKSGLTQLVLITRAGSTVTVASYIIAQNRSPRGMIFKFMLM